MHCYGRDLEKQAEEICRTKKCKWIPVVHRDWVELTRFFEVAGVSLAGRANNHHEECQRQIELCKNADFVVTIGPKVAEPFLNALQPYGKDLNVVSITPGIFSELHPDNRVSENQDTFNLLIVTDYPYLSSYFRVKGCDIAVKALLLLQDISYHLMVVMKSSYGVSELTQTLLSEGMQQNQFTVKTTNGDDPVQMAQFLNEADLLLLRSRVEGFGMSGIYAISAGLPVLISVYSGLGVALRKLPSGGKQVVDSDDPQVWAQKIKDIRAKGRESTSFETRQLREEYMQKYSWEDQCNKLVDKMMMGNVPAEILARGPLAIKAYNKAIEQGMTRVMRVPIMIIGQERSGKTSLKKSLKGQMFNSKEESTDGIELDPSYFSITTENWRTGETKEEPDSNSAISVHNRVAQVMVAHLRGDEVEQITPAQSVVNTISTVTVAEKGSKRKEAIRVTTLEKEENEAQTQTEKTATKIGSLLPGDRVKKIEVKSLQQEVPHTTAERVEKLLKESKTTKDDQVYSILWDFGGQSVYYATHPIFLTTKAIYLLAYDLRKDPTEIATPLLKEGVFDRKEDLYCTKTNEDYLHVWLSSVASLGMIDLSSKGSEKLPKRLPPVILVCTHADQCGKVAKDRARKIYGTLRSDTKPYGEHLYKKYFFVDNTRSGTTDECPEVQRLRNELLAVVTELPQLRQKIPLKWLRFEEALNDKKTKGQPFISLEEARRVARDKCGIDDDQQFFTLLNFLHDQRLFLHFDDTPELMDMMILDPQWLIDLFRKVITVKPYDPAADEHYLEELWAKLETDGILDDRLLQIVWGSFLKKEKAQSLIALMEKFSLVCSLPSVDNQKQFLVPSMLMSHPNQVSIKLLSEAFIPPLFIRFNQPRSQRYPGDEADCKNLQVPLGLFPRLIVKFLQWSIENEISPLYQDMYQNFARFPILPKGCSVILHCLLSCIEVVVHRDPGIASDTTIGYKVRRQLESVLLTIREECFWLRAMEYEFSVTCPVCCKQRAVLHCRKHQKSSCEKEECLHFWSESALQKKQICTRSAFAISRVVPMKPFSHWFEFAGKQMEDANAKFVLVLGDSLVKEKILTNVRIMDELARRLDQPIYRGEQEPPIVQHWKHLAAEFRVPEDVETRCQTNPQSSPSKHMFEFLEAGNPNF